MHFYKKEIPTEETDYDWPMVDKPCTPQLLFM